MSLLLWLAFTAHGACLNTVQVSAPDSIQAAIDGVADGDCVEVGPGTYAESLTLTNRAVEVFSSSGSGATVLTPAQFGAVANVVAVSGGQVRLTGFTIDGANLSRALHASNGAVLDVVDSAITRSNAGAGNGGSALVNGSEVHFRRVDFSNVALLGNDGLGGHIAASGTSAVTIHEGNLPAGQAHRGGAIYLTGAGAYLDLTDSLLTDNVVNQGGTGGNHGGALYLISAGDSWIARSTFKGNQVTVGTHGGAIRSYQASLLVEDSVFEANTTPNNGGAIAHDNGAAWFLTVNRSRFTGNRAANGGGVYCNGTCTVYDSWFESNSATGIGSALSMRGGEADSSGNVFCTNSGVSGSFHTDGVGPLYLDNNVFYDNIVTSAGAGAYLASTGTGLIENNHFVGNASSNVAAALYLTAGAHDLLDNLVVGNGSPNSAVGYRIAGTATEDHGLWNGNSASDVTNITLGTNSLTSAPALAAWPSTPRQCDIHDLLPGSTSPALGNGFGGDDIGAFGGLFPNGYVDLDNDGILGVYDCDDGDVSVGLPPTWYWDDDGDGLGNARDTLDACVQPSGYVADDTDCDDRDASIGAPGNLYQDVDGDGHGGAATGSRGCATAGFTTTSTDCDDANAAVNPDAAEICNGIDDNCNSLVDSNDPGVTGTSSWFRDVDGDGLGDIGDTLVQCDQPTGYVLDDTDCDDADASVGVPYWQWVDGDGDGYGAAGAPITDCPLSGYADNNLDCNDGDSTLNPTTVWFTDADGDGLGDDNTEVTQCADPGSGVHVGGDCDDANSAVMGPTSWWPDGDGDGYGSGTPITACPTPSGHADSAGDCNDNDATLSPATVWYADVDGDGFGDPVNTTTTCVQPAGAVLTGGDCDDGDDTVKPGATEVCNTVDDDCNGDTDDADAGLDLSTATDWYTDQDGDGVGVGAAIRQCVAPANSAAVDGDCDDNAALVYPGADELCDSADNDCDTLIDEGVQNLTWYLDSDADGWGDSGDTVVDCDHQPGRVLQGGDCADGDASVNPGVVEVCDSIDNDCSGQVDDNASDGLPYWVDNDGDGYGEPAAPYVSCSPPSGFATNDDDCNDANNQISPTSLEVCNSIDDDCDSFIDEEAIDRTVYYIDTDGDGHGVDATITFDCTLPAGYAATNDDCDDLDDTTYPGAVEQCDAVDNDCDTVVDNGVVDRTWYPDQDGDGFGDSDGATVDCKAPGSGWVLVGDDCDDTDDTRAEDCSDPDPTDPELPDESTRSPDDPAGGGDTDLLDKLPTGCGCTAAPGPGLWWMMAPLLLVRRRR